MKRWTVFLMCAALLLLLAGCGISKKPTEESKPAASSESETAGIGTIEHTDITEPMLKGEYIGKRAEEAGLPAENVFMSDEAMLSVDYVCCAGINGSVMCYLEEGKICSMNFGSTAFESQAEFNETIRRINKQIAATLDVEETELKFIGQPSDGNADELEQIFQGGGIFSAEYRSGGFKIVLNGIGINEAATVIIEMQPVEGGE